MNKRRGRVVEHVRNDFVKCGLPSKNAHCFDTHWQIAMVFAGSLLRISLMRSMGNVSKFSPAYIEEIVDECVQRLMILRLFTGLLFFSMFIAIFAWL